MRVRSARALVCAAPLVFSGVAARAQAQATDSAAAPQPNREWISELAGVNGDVYERARVAQLAEGVRDGQSFLLRSASSLTTTLRPSLNKWSVSLISPELHVLSNSAMPFSQNTGTLLGTKGTNTLILFGLKADIPFARLIVAPEYSSSDNATWGMDNDYYAPTIPPDRSEFIFPYYVGRFSIDQPFRYGTKRQRALTPGQSTFLLHGGKAELGASTENEWWGPGIRNAIVLSNNARGIPHLFVRTGAPLNTAIGSLDLRWLVGQLRESNFFDTVGTNNRRTIAALGSSLQTRWDPNLTIGFAHSVISESKKPRDFTSRWMDVFSNPSASDTAGKGRKKDQILSLFFRWVFPTSGLEVYSEWARTEPPHSLKDLFVAPNHTQGYTIGAQWRSSQSAAFWRLQTEITQLEQSATFRDRPVGSWYASARIPQGYTNLGQVIGASIGPGASSQWIAVDHMRPKWEAGGYLGRIRWNEDVHTNFGFPDYVSYCNHDLSLSSGVRGKVRGRFGVLAADLTLQNRLNAFFQNGGGCPDTGQRLDIRNNTLSIRYTPFAR